MVTTQLTALQGIALRARDRLASRIPAEFARQTNSAIAIDRVHERVLAQLRTRRRHRSHARPGDRHTPLSSTGAIRFNIQLKDTQVEDEEIAHLKEAAGFHGHEWWLGTAPDELGVCHRHIMVLEKEEEITLKLQEQEVVFQAFGKLQIPLSRSRQRHRVPIRKSDMSGVSPVSSERELAFSTLSTLVRRCKGTASPGASLVPPTPVALAHRWGSSLQYHQARRDRGSTPRQRIGCGQQRVWLPQLHDPE